MSEIGLEYLKPSPLSEKRRLDAIGSLALLGMLAPIGLVVAGTTAIDARTFNPLFIQERAGGAGGTLRALKFQTIPPQPSTEPRIIQGTFDTRASRFGQLLRRSGFDDAPQLINVLRGSMSLVGPRPLLDEDLERYRAADPILFGEWYGVYQQIKPGLTGDSQIFRHHYKGASKDLYIVSMQRDLAYFATACLQQDLKIIATTPSRMLRANQHIVDLTAPST